MRGTLALLALLVACDDGPASTDAGTDAPLSDAGTDAPLDVGSDAGDAAFDGGADGGSDGGIVGDGMRCEVLADYAATDIATLDDFHYLAAGRRVVRTDLSFGAAAEELVVEIGYEVRELHATSTEVYAITDTVRGADDSRLWLRDASGDWNDATPPTTFRSNLRVEGDEVAFVGASLDFFRREGGAWVAIDLPPDVSIRDFGAVGANDVHFFRDDTIWEYDGTDWTGTSVAPLGAPPAGPPPPPVTDYVLDVPIRSASGGLYFTYYLERMTGPAETGIAKLEDDTFTKLGPDLGGELFRDGDGFLMSGTYRSADAITWTDVTRARELRIRTRHRSGRWDVLGRCRERRHLRAHRYGLGAAHRARDT